MFDFGGEVDAKLQAPVESRISRCRSQSRRIATPGPSGLDLLILPARFPAVGLIPFAHLSSPKDVLSAEQHLAIDDSVIVAG